MDIEKAFQDFVNQFKIKPNQEQYICRRYTYTLEKKYGFTQPVFWQ